MYVDCNKQSADLTKNVVTIIQHENLSLMPRNSYNGTSVNECLQKESGCDGTEEMYCSCKASINSFISVLSDSVWLSNAWSLLDEIAKHGKWYLVPEAIRYEELNVTVDVTSCSGKSVKSWYRTISKCTWAWAYQPRTQWQEKRQVLRRKKTIFQLDYHFGNRRRNWWKSVQFSPHDYWEQSYD